MRRVTLRGQHTPAWQRGCALLGGVVVACMGVAMVWSLLWLRQTARELPDVPSLSAWRDEAPLTSYIVAADGTWLHDAPFTDGGAGRRTMVRLSDVPRVVVAAVVAAEDVRFLHHQGVDLRAVARAAWTNYRADRIVEGASTISQQLARGLLPDAIGNERSVRRKIREALLAVRLEQAWSKRELLEAYLNFVYVGNGAYGVAAGAQQYFSKALRDITVPEAALLAGVIASPSRLDPTNNPTAAQQQRDGVLTKMARAGFIDHDVFAAALATPVTIRPPRARYGTLAPWQTEHARQQAATTWPAAWARGGLTVETNVDVALADDVQRVVTAHLGQLAADARLVERGNGVSPEVAAIVWDHRTGYLQTVQGGANWHASQFNRALQSCRQPGSTWKPIVYAAALMTNAITAGTVLRDAPIAEYDDATGEHWKPKHSGDYRGLVLAQQALAASLNGPAIEVYRLAGGQAVLALARRLGITTELVDGGPAALGASCVKPIELAGAFMHVARGGFGAQPLVVTRVVDRGEVLLDSAAPEDPTLDAARRWDRLAALAGASPGARAGAAEEPAIDAANAFVMTDMLRAVVTSGTGAAARAVGRPVAGKTGTTNNNTDAWFVGFSARALGAVWLGYDDPSHQLAADQDGRRAAIPLWVNIMRAAEGSRPAAPLQPYVPADVVRVVIDPTTGLRAPPGSGGVSLSFRRGTEPTDATDAPAANDDFTRAGQAF